MSRNSIKNGLATSNNNDISEDVLLVNKFLHRLYLFYTDYNRVKLNFKKFIAKYAILVKGEPNLISNSLYFLYSDIQEKDKIFSILMTK